MLAARWPDDIRGDKAFDHPMWHYIDYPYKPKGQPASVPAPAPPAENMVAAFKQNVAIVQSAAPDDAEGRGAVLDLSSHGRFAPAPARRVSVHHPVSQRATAAETCSSSAPIRPSPRPRICIPTGTASCSTDDHYDPARTLAAKIESVPRSGHIHEVGRIALREMDPPKFRSGGFDRVSQRQAENQHRQECTGLPCLPIITPRPNELPTRRASARRLPAGGFPAHQFPLTSRVILRYGNRAFGLRAGLPGLLLHAGAGGERPRHPAARRPEPSRHARISVRQGRAISGARILARSAAVSAKARRRQRRRPLRAHFLG